MSGLVLRVKSLLNFISSSSSEEKSLKADVMEQGCVSLSVTEGINVPSNFGSHSEFILEPLMPSVEIADDVLVIGGSFISSNLASHGDFESSFFDKLIYGFFCIFILCFLSDGYVNL